MVLTVTRSSQPWPLLPLASRRGFPSVLGCNFSPTNSLGSPSSSQFLRVPQDWVWAHLFLWFLWFKTPVVPVRDEFPQHSAASWEDAKPPDTPCAGVNSSPQSVPPRGCPVLRFSYSSRQVFVRHTQVSKRSPQTAACCSVVDNC